VRAALGITALALLATACTAGVDEKELAMRRAQMVEEVAAMAAPTARETGRARLSDRVMGALRKVERHHFVPGSGAIGCVRESSVADRERGSKNRYRDMVDTARRR
jgi:hypothetical protein